MGATQERVRSGPFLCRTFVSRSGFRDLAGPGIDGLAGGLVLFCPCGGGPTPPGEGPLVTRANEIFISIAGNQPPDDFDKLDVDYQKPSDPRLIALRANGIACRVEAMSEGTRDQLWLALRIAALELRARDAEPMPFLADDLFASSDAVRTEAGIRYLAELARHTQVILFTHHDYVIDAARRMVPDARIHELTRQSPAA